MKRSYLLFLFLSLLLSVAACGDKPAPTPGTGEPLGDYQKRYADWCTERGGASHCYGFDCGCVAP